MAVTVNDENFANEVKSDKLVIADFYLDGCVPCKRLSPIIAELEEEFSDSVKFIKINAGFNENAVDAYDVQGAPTLIFFQNAEEKARLHGSISKPQVTEIINKLK